MYIENQTFQDICLYDLFLTKNQKIVENMGTLSVAWNHDSRRKEILELQRTTNNATDRSSSKFQGAIVSDVVGPEKSLGSFWKNSNLSSSAQLQFGPDRDLRSLMECTGSRILSDFISFSVFFSDLCGNTILAYTELSYSGGRQHCSLQPMGSQFVIT